MSFSEKQIEFFKNATHRWNFKEGAVRSGKTYGDYFVIPKRIASRRGKEGLNFIFGVSKGTIERNILEPMRNIWGETYVSDIRSDNTCMLFGEEAYCLGCEKVSQVSKIRGVSIKYAYDDEVAEWNEDVFQLIKSRLDKDYSVFDGALNPDSPLHWLKIFLDSDADIYRQHYTIFDNPFLPPSFVHELCKEYEGTVFYDRYILGEWTLAEGLIYPNFDNVVPTVEREYTRYMVSMDYGIQNATAMILWGLCKGTWYGIREYYHSGRETGIQKTDEEYYEELERLTKGLNVDRVIIDPSAESMIVLIRKKGRFKPRSAINDVLPGIAHVTTCLSTGIIQFNDCCKRTIQEFGLYSWDDKSVTDAPIKANDHAMDAVRYFVNTERIYNPQTEYKSVFG